jgi:hypothetical protein
MIEDLVRRQVKAIVISPNEPTSVEPDMADAISKGDPRPHRRLGLSRERAVVPAR